MNYTRGPWQIVHNAQSQWIVGDKEGGSIADCEPVGPWMSGAEADANCRLIAAAPDLLEVLEDCLREHGGFTIKGEIERRARAIIAKARGLDPIDALPSISKEEGLRSRTGLATPIIKR